MENQIHLLVQFTNLTAKNFDVLHQFANRLFVMAAMAMKFSFQLFSLSSQLLCLVLQAASSQHL